MKSSIRQAGIRRVGAASLLVAGFAAGGCTSLGGSQDAMIRANPTPELASLYQRRVDINNREAITIDENLRMANQDLARIFLLDRPSRLAREPVPR